MLLEPVGQLRDRRDDSVGLDSVHFDGVRSELARADEDGLQAVRLPAADVGGAQAHGMKTILVRTGKFRPDAVEVNRAKPDGIISSIAQLPDWLEEHL